MLTDMGNMVMLQVFVAGFVSKMMERIIAEQRVAAEHQRQIRDLQYADSQPPIHGVKVLVLLVGMDTRVVAWLCDKCPLHASCVTESAFQEVLTWCQHALCRPQTL